ncbi:hypothetical protein BH24CHL5_BH24CHL5_10940 [soil metagenome]
MTGRGKALLAGAVAGVVLGRFALLPLIGRVERSWRQRVAVSGHSMEPTLIDGDWLLVDPLGYTGHPPLPGELVVVRDPRRRDRLLVKRVNDIRGEGRLQLIGDHAAHKGDGDEIGLIDPTDVIGRPWLRYRPARRMGRL